MARQSITEGQLAAALNKRVAAALIYCEKYARKAETDAKASAEWTDRTGNARDFMTGFVIDDGTDIGWGLAHRVEYGKWLETANNGRYAILKPTVEKYKQAFYADLRKVFGDG